MTAKSVGKLVAACAFIVATVGIAPAAFGAGGHEHGAAAPILKLDEGRRWGTDAALRRGMVNIRTVVERELPAVDGGHLPDEHYEALGAAVEKQIAYIVQNCKLEPAADAVLHGLIAELSDGVEVVTGRKAADDRRTGVVRMVSALENYATYFDHPGWRPINADH